MIPQEATETLARKFRTICPQTAELISDAQLEEICEVAITMAVKIVEEKYRPIAEAMKQAGHP